MKILREHRVSFYFWGYVQRL